MCAYALAHKGTENVWNVKKPAGGIVIVVD
jgi:hypothetical protein